MKNGINKKGIFIDLISPFNKEHLFWPTNKAQLLNVKNKKEVLFTLMTGFAGAPRNAYKYNFENNKIYKSPHLTNNSFVNQIIDINGDGLDDIVISSYSSGN